MSESGPKNSFLGVFGPPDDVIEGSTFGKNTPKIVFFHFLHFGKVSSRLVEKRSISVKKSDFRIF